jgi:ribosomal protein S18 acetylase RimI-like enzyme
VKCEIREERIDVLPEYERIPIAFDVLSILEVQIIDQGLSGMLFSERRLSESFVKDYDALEKCRPTSWAGRWDISKWGLLSAFFEGQRVGGCVIAFGIESNFEQNGPELWDVRVLPEFRKKGIGSLLFDAAVEWAEAREWKYLRIETQNINVGACRFYAKLGCELWSIDRFAYPEFPDEIKLIWRKALKKAPEKSPS